jgi:UDP:flavonoid glycosyltransferase YjiC (YdhE family)
MPSALILLSSRGGGDRPPVIALALGMKKEGWKVTLLCDEETANLIQGTGLESIVFPENLDQRGSLRDWSKEVRSTDPPQARGVANPLVTWAELLLPLAQKTVAQIKPDIIISALFTMGLADELSKRENIPWCFINPSFYFGENLNRTWEEDWYPPVIPLFAEYALHPLAKLADISLHATDEVMDFKSEPMPENHHYVGFLLWEPKKDLPRPVLDSKRPWRLITTSTEPQREEINLVRAANQALGDLPGTTILTLPNKDLRDELHDLPSNTLVTGFLPHTPILKESELVISHAGHGIVSKSLYFGTPMLLLPWDRDQPGVAARATRLETSIIIDRPAVNPETVKSAALEIINNPTFKINAKKQSNRLRKNKPVQTSIKYIESNLI